ncbi:Uncharacterised protein [Vibrio cholerae]|nr:Uncharacterised protein [Vibrio cholerae]
MQKNLALRERLPMHYPSLIKKNKGVFAALMAIS